MNPNSSIDRELMYIAKQGLMEPVPEPWEAQRDDNDMILYYNTVTGDETHQHPCDEYYRQLFTERRQELMRQRGQKDDSQITSGEAGDKSVNETSQLEEPMVQSVGAMQ